MNNSILPIYLKKFALGYLRRSSVYINRFAKKCESEYSLKADQKKVLNRNLFFRGLHRNQPAYLLVNGPSLRHQDISSLRDQVTFVCNAFWKHDSVKIWQPTYYSLLDKNFFQDNESCEYFYINLNKNINGSKYFLPLFRGYDYINSNNFLPLEKTYYVACIGDRTFDNDLTGVVQGFAGVAPFLLAQAVYMECNPIYLLGYDHDYLSNRGIDHHFYSGPTIGDGKSAEIPLSNRIPYDQEMLSMYKLWQNYRRIEKFAKKKGIKIFNATDGGYLDVFERIEFSKIRPA